MTDHSRPPQPNLDITAHLAPAGDRLTVEVKGFIDAPDVSARYREADLKARDEFRDRALEVVRATPEHHELASPLVARAW